jgi:hypothetical protein
VLKKPTDIYGLQKLLDYLISYQLEHLRKSQFLDHQISTRHSSSLGRFPVARRVNSPLTCNSSSLKIPAQIPNNPANCTRVHANLVALR